MANLVNDANSPNFPCQYYKYSETTEDLPLDPPKFSSPLASSVAIRQNFPVCSSKMARIQAYFALTVIVELRMLNFKYGAFSNV